MPSSTQRLHHFGSCRGGTRYSWWRGRRYGLDFYDRLADKYHLIYEDWRGRAVPGQGEVLDTVIRARKKTDGNTVLDCSCGIGTQAIGLALRGYRVHATDLSPMAVERAKREAGLFGVEVTFGVADIRTVGEHVEGAFDVVLSADNSVAHLLTDDDLHMALASMRSRLEPGGLLVLGIRPYDQLIQDKPQSGSPRVFDGPAGRRIVFQVWDWAESAPTYILHLFILEQAGDDWTTHHFVGESRALLQHEVEGIARDEGFSDLHWHMPDDTGYHQPVLTAYRS